MLCVPAALAAEEKYGPRRGGGSLWTWTGFYRCPQRPRSAAACDQNQTDLQFVPSAVREGLGREDRVCWRAGAEGAG